MKQMSVGAAEFERKTKRTRKSEFVDEMNLVVTWAELASLIAPHAHKAAAKGGRPPFPQRPCLGKMNVYGELWPIHCSAAVKMR